MTPARFPREVRGPAPIKHLAKHQPPSSRAAAPSPGHSPGLTAISTGGPGTSGSRGRLRKARESQEAALPRHPRRPPAPGSPCPPGHPPATRVLALLAPGRPPPPSLPLPALAPPGPAPDTHLRRLRAGRTAAFQLREESIPEKQGKKYPVSERANGRNPRRARAAPKAAPRTSTARRWRRRRPSAEPGGGTKRSRDGAARFLGVG